MSVVELIAYILGGLTILGGLVAAGLMAWIQRQSLKGRGDW